MVVFLRHGKRSDHRFRLLKEGGEDAVNREILASRICRCFDVDQVLYEEGMFDGEKVSISDMNIMDYLTGNTSCEASQADGF